MTVLNNNYGMRWTAHEDSNELTYLLGFSRRLGKNCHNFLHSGHLIAWSLSTFCAVLVSRALTPLLFCCVLTLCLWGASPEEALYKLTITITITITTRNMTIKNKVMELQESGGPWKPISSASPTTPLNDPLNLPPSPLWFVCVYVLIAS